MAASTLRPSIRPFRPASIGRRVFPRRWLTTMGVVFLLLSRPTEARRAARVADVADPAVDTLDPSSVEPYFEAGALAAAAAALNDGQGASVLERLPDRPDTTPVRFLRALALLQSGDPGQAAMEFEQLAEDYPLLSARCHCLAADSFNAIGDTDRAVQHWGKCVTDPVRGRQARVERARGLEKLGKVDEAVDVLQTLIQEGSAAQKADAAFALAGIREGQGQLPEAIDLYRRVLGEWGNTQAGDRARVRLVDLSKQSRAALPPTEKLAERVESLLVAGQLKMAQAALKDLPRLSLCEGAACTYKRCRPLVDTHVASPAKPAAAASPTTSTPAPEVPPESDPSEPVTESTETVAAEPPASVAPSPIVAAKPFRVATATDDEADAGAPLPTPACAVVTPSVRADPLTCRLQLVRGWIARKNRQYREALQLLRPVYERCGEASTRARALWMAQQAAAAVKDPDAVDLGLLVASQFPKSDEADQALLGAAIAARDRDEVASERLALRHLVRDHPDSELRPDALFRLYWSHRRAGRPDRGLWALDEMAKKYEANGRVDGGDSERGRYWWGRTVMETAVNADRAKGTDALARLAHDRPLTYYGMLAWSALVQAGRKPAQLPPRVTPASGPLHTGPLASDPAFQQALEMWRLGQIQAAKELLLAIDHKPLRSLPQGREHSLLVAELLARMGDLRQAHMVARRELIKTIREDVDPLARRAAAMAYPPAFRDLIGRFAPTHGVSPDFLQGLMREESTFDPRALSPVGARGLTQVMPATGWQVAKALGLRGFDPSKLFDPPVSVQVGAAYLGRVLASVGHPGLAAAAYNAGPNAVSRWMSHGKRSFDAFVEEIPYLETRNYVKRVLRSYAVYHLLYSGATEPLAISFVVREKPEPFRMVAPTAAAPTPATVTHPGPKPTPRLVPRSEGRPADPQATPELRQGSTPTTVGTP